MDLPAFGQLALGLAQSKKKFRLPQVSEAQIERAICDFLRIRLKNKKAMFWKQPNRGYFRGQTVPGTKMTVGYFRKDSNPYTRQGVPDIILIYRGLFVGLEIKTETGKLTGSQIDFRREVQEAEGFYFVVRSTVEVESILKGIETL